MPPISIKDIARVAGVSHSTVSRALSDSGLVNTETADRIRRIAGDAGYMPSAVGRSLVTRRTRTIGVVVNTISDPFNADVLSGIEEVANTHKYSVFLATSHSDPEREVVVARSLQEQRVDGILISGSRVGSMYISLLAQTRVPIVLINNQHPSAYVLSVTIDNIPASRAATGHLVHLGHRRIGYIGNRFGDKSETERFTGYGEALAAAGIDVSQELIAHGDGMPEGGKQAMERLLGLADIPTAVFCYNDMTAFGAMHLARERGLRIPQDISVVGFDDLFIASYTSPPLTTVRQPKQQMGRLATENLFKLLAGEDSENDIKMQGELIVRESTGPPRR
jgi:DNA-binding LacI/PurR family transcriptional regulator